MSQTTLTALQSLLIFLQMANAGISGMTHLNPIISVLLSAGVGSFQYFVQHLGNQSVPQVTQAPK